MDAYYVPNSAVSFNWEYNDNDNREGNFRYSFTVPQGGSWVMIGAFVGRRDNVAEIYTDVVCRFVSGGSKQTVSRSYSSSTMGSGYFVRSAMMCFRVA